MLVGPAVAETPDERVTWDGTPLAVTVPVGGERLVRFPEDAVRIGVPKRIADKIRVYNNDGIAYFQAHETFAATRVVVEATQGGGAYFLDLQASEGATTADLVVERSGASGSRDSRGDRSTDDRDGAGPRDRVHRNLDYITLTRYAAQTLYAPSRLRPEAEGIRAVALDDDPVDLVRGGAVAAEPVAAWRGGGRFVTAVRLTNRTDDPVILDPRELRGRWLAATFQHGRLQPAGDPADTTAVYLVSERPFADSFWGAR
ncbi:TIGR03749 family integrating conjugative element protein [Aquisalimonas lutea]|uniref:TIGR03749 family integrating conjugative element protein n=1 Tax=Aquisalimonas lutea TaxID=1327750 RepID=UPI0025B44034|nr:TIGR03749 family integrating conjugative element protein [Aquisalimonas lutea]MDN3519013.1 TIGR03749 family integrating conjugative element protein [Aquisalimonas lutea]